MQDGEALVVVRLAVRRALERTEQSRQTYRREWRHPASAWRLAMCRAWGWTPRLSDEVLFMRATIRSMATPRRIAERTGGGR